MPSRRLGLLEAARTKPVQLPFLTERECQRLSTQVLSLRRQWQRGQWLELEARRFRRRLGYRNSHIPFFILGAPTSHSAYGQGAVRLLRGRNRLLLEEFPSLYRKLRATLQNHLHAPVEFGDQQPVPGFQILESHPVFLKQLQRLHVDIGLGNLLWTELMLARLAGPRARRPIETISFTVPISIPTGGASLIYKRAEAHGAWLGDGSQSDPAIAQLPARRHSYRLGHLTIHSAMNLHTFGAWRTATQGERRITLQGLGLLRDGRWILYW